jgi:hypothetical protein
MAHAGGSLLTNQFENSAMFKPSLIKSDNTSELLATILCISEYAYSSLMLANLGMKFH